MKSSVLRAAALAVLCFCPPAPLRADASTPAPPPAVYADPKADVEARVADLVKRLHPDEKLNLLALDGSLQTHPIPRLGIPAFRMADGPNGVRDGQSTAFPLGISLASTWNPSLARQVGVALGQECRGHNRQVLFGPCVNIHRTPQGGRNGESFSEDPFLASEMTVAYIDGIQSQGVAACVKHFAFNNQETQRHSINIAADERTMREIELPAFEAAFRRAHAWSTMAAFNQLNGTYVTANAPLLKNMLEHEWKWDGFVVSDYGAIHETVGAINAGTDLELPTPSFFTPAKLQEALDKKQITPATINGRVRRLVRAMVRTGTLDGPRVPDPKLINTPAHQTLVRKVAQQGIVLLKNEGGVLPFNKKTIKSIAVVGPNANPNSLGGRWSADVAPFYSVSPLDGITKKAGKAITVNYAGGVSAASLTLTPVPGDVLRPEGGKAGETGLRGEYFDRPGFRGKPALTRLDPQIQFDWGTGSPDKAIPVDHFSARWTGRLVAPKTGQYLFGLNSDDGSRLFLGDQLLIDNGESKSADHPRTGAVELQAGRSYPVRVEFNEDVLPASVRLGWIVPNTDADLFKDAVAAARKSDVAVVVVGLNKDLEGEELDPPDLNLPGTQDALVQAVAAVNKKTVVVLVNGTPILTDKWVSKAPGLIEAWYAGQEAGNALADVLFGDVNPSGKLTDTLAFRREDYSDLPNYPGTNGTVKYAEGIYVGYRHFDRKKIAPQFPFGYGLSYTTFALSNLTVPAVLKPGVPARVSVAVQNTGKRAGAEVVQLYVHDLAPKVDRPIRELKGFARVSLAPGQKSVVTIPLDDRAFAFYDVKLKKWKANPGRYEIQVGASSRDIRQKGVITLL